MPMRVPELGADLESRRQALHGLRRWHPDVHDRDVRRQPPYGVEQGLRVTDLRDHVEPLQAQELRDPCPEQSTVVGQDYAHGRSTSIRVPPPCGLTTVSVPPVARTRSASPANPDPAPWPAPPARRR